MLRCCDVDIDVAMLTVGSLPPLLEQSPLNVPPSGVGTLTTLTASCTRVWPRSRADEAIVYARGSSGGSSGRARYRAAARRVDYEREHGVSSHIPNAPTQSVRATASAMPQVRARTCRRTCMHTCMHTCAPIHHKLRIGARSAALRAATQLIQRGLQCAARADGRSRHIVSALRCALAGSLRGGAAHAHRQA
jgi:hypothetical protein